MKMKNLLLVTCLSLIAVVSCKKDDENGIMAIPARDRAEVDAEDVLRLQTYLETHFYNYEEFENPTDDFDYNIRLDTIAGSNAGRTPLIERPELMSQTVNRFDFEYTYYILKVREGAGTSPTYADSTFVTFKGQLLQDDSLFDSAVQPIWFDLPGGIRGNGVVRGFAEALTNFKDSSGFVENSDNTVTFNDDYGIGAGFLPSGLAFFSTLTAGIPQYSPLIFTFNLFVSNQADHDNDGIPSIFEDLNNNGELLEREDDTDLDGFVNYIDSDDDNDGTPTRDEIVVNDLNGDGIITLNEITFTDTNGDGTPDYLQIEDGRDDNN